MKRGAEGGQSRERPGDGPLKTPTTQATGSPTEGLTALHSTDTLEGMATDHSRRVVMVAQVQ